MENGIANGQIKRDHDVQYTCMRAPPRNASDTELFIPRPFNTQHPLRSPRGSPRLRKQYSGRKLILHFDVRNTILVADTVDNINVEQALNSFLTGVTWGKQTINGWEWFSDRPTLRCPQRDTITYYKHLEKEIVRVPSDRAKLRRMTGDFTQKPIGKKFATYCQKHLKYLEWQHPNDRNKSLTMEGTDGKLYHYILPAFYRLIHHLHKNNREFSIVIRTYGLDAPNVLQSINLTMLGRHPEFPNVLPIDVTPECGKVVRKKDAIQVQIPNRDHPGSSVLKDDRTIYNYLTETTGIRAFVDDFPFWQKHGYQSECAKPLWIDPSRTNVQHIMFDDNIRVTDEDSIVDVRVFDSAFSGKARSLNQQDAAKFEDMCLVQADLLESTSNTDYFIEKVQKCEKRYDDYLHSLSKR